ncbi:hypothetical protein ACLMJK_005141 [Lecanora helva]
MNNDFVIPWETKSLIQSSKGVIYPSRIPSQHHQLKNLIGIASTIIYHTCQHEIYSLNLSDQKRTLIQSLPWKPVCLDAAHGWICAGGDENGQCAFIRIHDTSTGGAASQSHAEVDDLLPLDLDPEYRHARHDFRRAPGWAQFPSRPKYELQHHETGGNRVNSVKIHRLPNPNSKLQDEIVVVITNNDRTVKIFSLSQFRPLQAIEYPTRMNHASISPDGNLLLAVGDETSPRNDIRAFFASKIDRHGGGNDYKNEWHKFAEPKIVAGFEDDPYFCTAFSPSGHICAVASQAGIITFFDTSRIQNDVDTKASEAVIAVLKSSRPSNEPYFSGAIRSMCFSPAPWDLFAWAEDRGRVCVVDLRDTFQSRQTLDLEIDIERIDIHDYDSTSERQLEIERRFVERQREALEAQDHLAAVSHTADYLELAAEQRRLERENLQPLSPSERQMIDSIGLRRSQDSYAATSETQSAGPISVNYNPHRSGLLPTWTGRPSSTSPANYQNRSTGTGTASIHDFMRHRNWERSRANDRSHQPRRRSSVVISNSSPLSHSHSNSNTYAPTPYASSRLAPIGSGPPTLSASPSRIPSSSTPVTPPQLIDTSESWQTISDAMSTPNLSLDTIARLRTQQSRNHGRRAQSPTDPQAILDRRIEAISNIQAGRGSMRDQIYAVGADTNRTGESHSRSARQMRSRAADEIDREMSLRRFEEPMRRTRNEEGVVTTGIGWSVDGRNLFVATEEGILEYPVNIAGRKTFPGTAFL